MKINWNKVFSISVSEEDYFKDQNDKIEFTGCKLSGEYCLDYLPKINECFRVSEQFYRAKDFNRAIDALENAYAVTEEMKEPSCHRCALFFKATVIQSLENIHTDLIRMTKGIFSTKRYQSSCIKAEDLLAKLKTTKEVKTEFPISGKSMSLQPAYLS